MSIFKTAMKPSKVIVLRSLILAREVFQELFNDLSSSLYFSIGLRVFHPSFDIKDLLLFQELLKHVLPGVWAGHFW